MDADAISENVVYTKAQIRARRRFKALVRLVIENLRWLQEDNIYYRIDVAHKDVTNIQMKKVLRQPPEERTEEDVDFLYKKLGELRCMRKYPETLRGTLLKYSYFVCYGPGRTIIRENHEPKALYMILSGEVQVSNRTFNSVTQEEEVNVMGLIQAGGSFGELELLFDLPRDNTVISTSYVELLKLDQEEFNIFLKKEVKKEWDHLKSAIDRFTYFDGFDDKIKRQCLFVAKVKTFNRHDTILGDGRGMKDYVHFVLHGRCQLVEHLLIENVTTVQGKSFQRLYELPSLPERDIPDQTSPPSIKADSRESSVTPRTRQSTMPSKYSAIKDDEEGSIEEPVCIHLPSNVQTVFMQVCIFSEMACFGVGEDFENRRVVALTEVECLLVPSYWIAAGGKAMIWTQIVQYLNKNLPATKKLYYLYKQQKKWREYTAGVALSLAHRTPCNTVHNIPYTIRIKSDYLFNNK